MFFIDVEQFRHGRTKEQAEAVASHILGLVRPVSKSHQHSWSMVLINDDHGHGQTLSEFEAPCPNGDKANHVRMLVHELREVADELESAFADILDDTPASVIRDLLLVVGVDVTQEAIQSWTPAQRAEAENWAARTHVNASDHDDVTVPERPAFLAEAELGEG